MENETSKTRSLNVGFLVDAESLTNLEGLLQEVKGALEFKVRFSDGSTVKYSDAEEILKQPNSQKRLIVSIIASVEGNHGQAASITLRENPEPSIEYTINGPQRNVIYFSDKLDDWIQSCRQWYSGLFSSSGQLIKVIGGIALALYCANLISKKFPESTGLPALTAVAVGMAEFYLLKLFPRGTFAVGYGQRRDDLFSKIRNGVLLALGVSVLAEVLLKALSRS